MTNKKPQTQMQIRGHAEQDRMWEITLHGRLACFGPQLRVMARDATQLITALAAQKEGFARDIRQGRYRLIAGDVAAGRALHAAELTLPLNNIMGDATTLHLLPTLGGAARGRGKALLGLTLLGLSFIPGVNTAIGGAFATAGGETFRQFGGQLLGRVGGLALLAGGLELLTPQTPAPAGTLPSSGIATPETTGQGAALPLVYGTARVEAPVVISSGLDVETH